MAAHKTSWLLAGLLLVCSHLASCSSPGARHSQSPEVDEAYNRYSEMYAQGRYQEALPFAERALRLSEHEFGPDHPNTAILLANVAGLSEMLVKYAEAELLYKRALAIQENAPGAKHSSVAPILNNLASLYQAQGKYTEAEPLYKLALAIWEKAWTCIEKVESTN